MCYEIPKSQKIPACIRKMTVIVFFMPAEEQLDEAEPKQGRDDAGRQESNLKNSEP